MPRKEIQRLHDIGVLRKIEFSRYGAYNMILRNKSGGIRFVTDFRKLNLTVQRHPYPLPNVNDVLRKIR